MKIAILGYDLEGSASYDYLVSQDHEVVIHDQDKDKQVPEGAKSILGSKYLDHLDEYDLLVRTPGMHPDLILKAHKGLEDKITSGTNLFFENSPTKNIIGVTGTKGKGTTSTLITKILEAAGNKVWLGGNIGVPALSFISEVGPDDWVVLELSSFQLIDCKYSPNVAVCLMVVPEHLNWHKSLKEYHESKQQLFVHQRTADLAVYNASNATSMDIVRPSPALKAWYQAKSAEIMIGYERQENLGYWVENDRIFAGGEDIAAAGDIALLGEHNRENVCAAIAATWEVTGHNVDAVTSVITTFKGLPHRLELVRELNGVRYYDDSFGTTPETAIVAMQAFKEPKVVILGGSDKGAEYDELAKAVLGSQVRTAIVIGDTGPKIEKALLAVGYNSIVQGGDTMEKIINTAKDLAVDGDIVLLSTGCASFGMFQNYKDRAQKFVDAVNAL